MNPNLEAGYDLFSSPPPEWTEQPDPPPTEKEARQEDYPNLRKGQGRPKGGRNRRLPRGTGQPPTMEQRWMDSHLTQAERMYLLVRWGMEVTPATAEREVLQYLIARAQRSRPQDETYLECWGGRVGIPQATGIPASTVRNAVKRLRRRGVILARQERNRRKGQRGKFGQAVYTLCPGPLVAVRDVQERILLELEIEGLHWEVDPDGPRPF